ncbi:MAG: hypothetical protein QUS14_00650 [Pyrinomonadaceae bacterium]|nr:hypothetical protein [Pyrinomonadaceae bacterium]
MNEKRKDGKQTYDVPIKRPFEELPEWFARTLNSRYTTKREIKPGNGYSDAPQRSAGSRQSEQRGDN